MSLRSPLASALNRGSAHEGVGHWIVQRVTALALAPLSIWLLLQLLSLPQAARSEAARRVSDDVRAVLCVVCMAVWLG